MKHTTAWISKLCLLLLFGLLLTHPKQSAFYAAAGLTIWYTSIVPVLLPSMIVSGLLIRTRACNLLHPLLAPIFRKLFRLPDAAADAFLVGILCGYPSGAAVTGELLQQSKLTNTQAAHLLQFCNYPSPMFLTGLILSTALKGQVSAPVFLLSVYLSGICTGILTTYIRKCHPENDHPKTEGASPTLCGNTDTFFQKLETSLMTAARTILIVGLYLMLFRIFSGMAMELLPLPPFLLALLTGLLEMTSGIMLLAKQPLSLYVQSILILFLSVFGGISTWLQAVSVMDLPQFPTGHYLTGRLLHSTLAVLLFLLLSRLS